jgi:hypothetical protein
MAKWNLPSPPPDDDVVAGEDMVTSRGVDGDDPSSSGREVEDAGSEGRSMIEGCQSYGRGKRCDEGC